MTQLYTCEQDDDGGLFQMRRRVCEWWGNCGPVCFPIVFHVVEARRVERRWYGLTNMTGWYRAGPETYTEKRDGR